MAIYVSFNDSKVDPTYSLVDNVILVDSDSEDGNENPCVDQVNMVAPVIPINYNEVVAYAKMMGWGMSTDSDGNVVLHTHIPE